MLDNLVHVKAYWILMDVPIATLALDYGANDVDGTVVAENIHHEAGATSGSDGPATRRLRPGRAGHAVRRALASRRRTGVRWRARVEPSSRAPGKNPS